VKKTEGGNTPFHLNNWEGATSSTCLTVVPPQQDGKPFPGRRSYDVRCEGPLWKKYESWPGLLRGEGEVVRENEKGYVAYTHGVTAYLNRGGILSLSLKSISLPRLNLMAGSAVSSAMENGPFAKRRVLPPKRRSNARMASRKVGGGFVGRVAGLTIFQLSTLRSAPTGTS